MRNNNNKKFVFSKIMFIVTLFFSASISCAMERLYAEKRKQQSAKMAVLQSKKHAKRLAQVMREAEVERARAERAAWQQQQEGYRRQKVNNVLFRHVYAALTREHDQNVLNELAQLGIVFDPSVSGARIDNYITQLKSYICQGELIFGPPMSREDREFARAKTQIKASCYLLDKTDEQINLELLNCIEQYVLRGSEHAIVCKFHYLLEGTRGFKKDEQAAMFLVQEGLQKGAEWAYHKIWLWENNKQIQTELLRRSVSQAHCWTIPNVVFALSFGRDGYNFVDKPRVIIDNILKKNHENVLQERKRILAIAHATSSHISNSHTG